MAIANRPDLSFPCPVQAKTVQWAAKDVFNPAAVVKDGLVHLLVRAEDAIGVMAGTSRLGLATSADGVTFELRPEPVLFPADDHMRELEWPGGCEDPRLVESPEGGYVCIYTAFDGSVARLAVATSGDLVTWTKHGLAFAGTAHERRWSKAPSVVTEVVDGRLVAARVNGRYWMYWGEGTLFAATSDDLIRWEPVEAEVNVDRAIHRDADGRWRVEHPSEGRALLPLVAPRTGRHDSGLVEPGPPALLTEHGIVLLHNAANLGPEGGDPSLPFRAYAPGQLLFDPLDPRAVLARTTEPFLRPETTDEQTGQVDNVCFVEGLVLFNGEWRLYFGMADSKIGCATAPVTAPA